MAEKVAAGTKNIGKDSDQQEVSQVSQVSQVSSENSENNSEPERSNHGQKWYASVLQPGSATQIVIAAVLAIGLGLGITAAVDEVPEAAIKILAIPGQLWLRCLKAVGMLYSVRVLTHLPC